MKLSEIEQILSGELPESFELSKYEHIDNLRFMVDSHILFLKSNPGNKLFKPYYERLLKIAISLKEKV